MYLFDFARRSEAFNDYVVVKMELGLNSACFVQVNRLFLSKSYEKKSGELTKRP